jgi:hypothetical protein
MKRVELAIDVDAPASDIWAVLTDLRRYPEWIRSLNSVDVLTEGDYGVGTRYRLTAGAGDRTVQWQVEITGLEQEKRIDYVYTGDVEGNGGWRIGKECLAVTKQGITSSYFIIGIILAVIVSWRILGYEGPVPTILAVFVGALVGGLVGYLIGRWSEWRANSRDDLPVDEANQDLDGYWVTSYDEFAPPGNQLVKLLSNLLPDNAARSARMDSLERLKEIVEGDKEYRNGDE